MKIKLCKKHYKDTLHLVFVKHETKCEFCQQEHQERMKKFGIVDYKKQMENSRDKFIKGK